MGSGESHSERAIAASRHVVLGTAADFERLYETHFPRITRFLARRGIPRASLDDLAQEVFARAWANRHDHPFDPTFRRFLWGIVKNVLREQRRPGITGLLHQIDDAGEMPAPDLTLPAEDLERRERIEQVQAALASLPPRQRQAVELVEMGNLTIEKAAKIAGCTYASLRWQRDSAIQHLKKLLEREIL